MKNKEHIYIEINQSSILTLADCEKNSYPIKEKNKFMRIRRIVYDTMSDKSVRELINIAKYRY